MWTRQAMTPGLYDMVYGQLISVSMMCDGLDVAAFLRAARGRERFYWENRRDGYALAGFGITAELVAWGDRFVSIQQQARSLFTDAVVMDSGQPLAGPRLFGGFAFQDDFVPDNTWTIYTPGYFVLPHYQLAQQGEHAWLTINVHIAADEDTTETLAYLEEALRIRYEELLAFEPAHYEPAVAIEVNYPLSYSAWDALIKDATGQIKRGAFEKVVLSRVAEVRFGDMVDVDSALDYLRVAYADCYCFLFEPRPYHAFYGATPELLAAVHGRQLQTMALAGSIRRGKTPQEDAQYADEILHDAKNRHEHAVVVEAVCERLLPLVDDLQLPDAPGLLRLSNIQHLYTPIVAELRSDDGVLPVIEKLHPTPAMGGKPRDVALAYISQMEAVPRGWYAAPIGWVDARLDGVFGVGIRSAVSQDRREWMYAGAGIMGDSDPQKEWEETALKFRPMLDALGIREQVDG